MPRPLTPELAAVQRQAEEAAREAGLDFFTTIFELLDYEEMNQVAAYGGFATRYPHWRFGMEYERQSKGYRYGLHKIYEMVINNDPCYAYLLDVNPLLDQKLVMAHVYGHCDFFKNNAFFAATPRKMMDGMAEHAVRIRRIMNRHGVGAVEDFIDAALSLENLIDVHKPFIHRASAVSEIGEDDEEEKPTRLDAKGKRYLDKYVNPKEYIEAQQRKLNEARERSQRFPTAPQKDVMEFLLHHAPLAAWQQEVLAIVRDEAQYFAPQGMTKIMNEGWASYWHTTLMTRRLLTDDEVIDYADHHSGTVAQHPGRLNPYKIGLELFRDIEDRWNRGRHGKDYEECEDRQRRARWDTGEMAGLARIFQARRIHNDVTFIDEYLTEDFCRRHKLFVYEKDRESGDVVLSSRDFQRIKQTLLFQLTNFGQPEISVVDANHANRGELLLEHRFEGVELDRAYGASTLRNLHRVWGRPVHIATATEEHKMLLSCDGDEVRESVR